LEVWRKISIFAGDILFVNPLNKMRMKRKNENFSGKSCLVGKLLITLQP
jgi:hypothetical protein